MESGKIPSIPQETVKLAFIGWSQSGKTALTDVILKNKKRYMPKNKALGGKRNIVFIDYLDNLDPNLDLDILDYSCDELSRCQDGSAYEGTDLAIFTLDGSADNYEEQLAFLVEERRKLLEKNPNASALLILTKNDLTRKISNDELKDLKKTLNVSTHFASSLIIKKGEFQDSLIMEKLQHHIREAVKRVAAERAVYAGKEALKAAPFVALAPLAAPAAPGALDFMTKFTMPILKGKLSESQQKINLQEFKNFFINNPHYVRLSQDLETKFQDIVKAIWVACDEHLIVLNSDLRTGMGALMQLINDGLKKKAMKLEDFQDAARRWGQYYKGLETKAGQENVSLLGNQQRGIVRGLRDHGRIPPAIWCEDLDLKEVLKGLMIEPEVLAGEGTYILPPTSLSTTDYIFNYLDTILKKKKIKDLEKEVNKELDNELNKPIRLMIPVQTGGHWRCIQVNLAEGVIVSATLWDSMADRKLADHYSYKNMVKAVERAQAAHHPDKKVIFTAEAAGVQVNGWSCGDYVSQKCLQAFPELADPFQAAVRDADPKNPLLLRTAIINRILELHPEQKARYVAEPVRAPSPPPRAAGGFMPFFGAANASGAANPSSAGLFGRGDPEISDRMFLDMMEKIETWVASEPNEANNALRVHFQDSMASLKKKIYEDVSSGAMTTNAAVYAVERSADLSELVLKGDVTGNEIDAFHRRMINLSSNYSWRVIVGAVIGAVVGVVVGAMITAACGPLVALSALYLASQSAILGSVFFGTLGLALGTGVGIWRTIQNDPVVQVANSAEFFKQTIPLDPQPDPGSVVHRF